MLKFISFGSGSSGNCYYFSAGSEGLLIDAGIGMRTLKKYLHDYNIKLDEIKNILVTHDHADHIKAVGVLSTDYNMPVYATKEVHNGIMRNYCVHKKIPSANTKVIEKNVRIKVGDLYITPFTVPHDSSDNVGYCIESDGLVFCLMTDVGHVTDEMKKYLHDYNIKLDEIKRILITHDHADHIKAVGVLSTDYNMHVYATKEVHNGIMRNYCVHKKIPASNTKVIEKNVRIKVGDFFVTPFTVPHDSSDNVGYCIESEGIVFCLMTDAGHVTDEMKKYISMSDYLVLEANYDEEMLRVGNYPQYLKERIASDRGHLSNKDCGEALANNATEKLKKVWLCHLSEENNHPVLAQKTVEQVLRSYGIIAGKDFQLEILKRKSASELFEIDGII